MVAIEIAPAGRAPLSRGMISLNEGGAPGASRAEELAAATFAADGWLCRHLKLEHRPEQERLARTIANSFAGDTPLLCEAGTGVGKSLAYLVPGLVHAVDTGRQLLVSTHTKTLQEQIRDHDLANCRRLFATVPDLARYRDFTSTVLMGKGNYLCTSRLARALAARHELFTSAEQEVLTRLARWREETATGLLTDFPESLSPELWDEVSADAEACASRFCSAETCFFQRARRRRDTAQLVIVNHSLLFTLMMVHEAQDRSPAQGLLRLDDFAVLDEAHTVPDIATEHLGLAVGSHGLRRLLRSLHHPTTRKGLLARHGRGDGRRAVELALERAEAFFAAVAARIPPGPGLLRRRETGDLEDPLSAPLQSVAACLDALRVSLPDGSPAQAEVEGRQRRVAAYATGIKSWLDLARGDHVHWAEAQEKRSERVVTLRSAPLDVSRELNTRLFRRDTAVVLTSATLATGAGLEPFGQRVGAHAVDGLIERSPFDYKRNMRVYVAADVPEPSGHESRLALDALADYVRFCALAVRGGSLVLFTSFRDLQEVALRLAPACAEAGRPLLVQETGRSRTELVARLRRAGNAILLGTESFWTGIDVPGPSLSQVIITRLPFEPPNHPVAQARAEWVASEGGNPFAMLALPEALRRFRQGIGRLIRSRSDQGVVTILDARILTKPYGPDFVACLPHPAITRLTRADRSAVFRPFVRGGEALDSSP